MKLRETQRHGTALIVILVMMAILASGTATIVWNGVAARRFLQRRENGMQAEWLARGGIERARLQLLKGIADNEWRPLGERAIVRISTSTKDGVTEIRAEATYPADDSQPAVREVMLKVTQAKE